MRRLLAILSAFVAVAAVVAVPVTAKKHAKKPGCRAFFSHKQVVDALGGSASIGKIYETTQGQFGRIIGPASVCGAPWGTSSNPPAGDPYESCDRDALGSGFTGESGEWIVKYGYSKKQWAKLVKFEKAHHTPLPDPNANPKQKFKAYKHGLGRGSKAFYVHDPVFCNTKAPPYALQAWALYVYTKHHDLLVISLWPSPIESQVGLATYVLRHHRPSF